MALLFSGMLAEAAPHRSSSQQNLVRVRVAHSLSSTVIKGHSLSIESVGSTFDFGPSMEELQIELQSSEGVSQWSVTRLSGGETKYFSGSSLSVVGMDLWSGKNRLPPRVSFLAKNSSGRSFDLLVNLELEQYLANVLPHEMPASWPIEALKAQAIAARSYTLYQQRHRAKDAFDVESTILDQAFKYKELEDSKWREKVLKVLHETKGMVLQHSSLPIKAYYHADCGGTTELASNVWGGHQKFNGHVSSCPFKSAKPWEYRIERAFLVRLLANSFEQNLSGKTLSQISIDSRTDSGRVKNIKFSFSEGGFVQVSSQSLRETLGFSKLKSAHFKVQLKEDEVFFEGIGHGHGVGLCQRGARFLASKGESFRSILSKYYPDSRLAAP
ncbi:SpoIID/LytB domain-containing protein [bacterium]|nr:SpoIID/LytB domain-containing protein [bacterium]